MFVKNNERIDFPELERRASAEMERLARAPAAPTTERPVQPEPGPAAPRAPEAAVNDAAEIRHEPPPARTISRSLAHLIWGVLHLPTVLRRLISGYYAAIYARSQVDGLAETAGSIQMRIAGIETAIGGLVAAADTSSLRLTRLDQAADAIQARQTTGEAATEDAISQLASATMGDRERLTRLTEAMGAIETNVVPRIREAESRVAAAEVNIATLREQAADILARLDTIARDAASADLATRTDELAARSARLSEQLAMVRREVMFQQRQLTRLAVPASDPTETAPAVSRTAGAAETAIQAQRYDSLYAAFEDVFRGSREIIIERLAPYVERLTLAAAGQSGKPVLDVGCGRGEWLELLRREGLSAYGIDINSVMVERTTAFGLDARQADVMTHLRGLEDASLSAVSAFHILEHLPFETVVDFLDEVLRVLIPGGTLIAETPNPETVRVGASTFWYDPTHRNPLMPASLSFIVEHRGFAEVEVLRLHPFVQALLSGTSENVQLLNQVLFGPQDFAIVARRL